jgi:hypothetical protein
MDRVPATPVEVLSVLFRRLFLQLRGTNVESRVEPEVPAASLQRTAPLDTKPTESGIEAKRCSPSADRHTATAISTS